jgi:hypothetical protein
MIVIFNKTTIHTKFWGIFISSHKHLCNRPDVNSHLGPMTHLDCQMKLHSLLFILYDYTYANLCVRNTGRLFEKKKECTLQNLAATSLTLR